MNECLLIFLVPYAQQSGPVHKIQNKRLINSLRKNGLKTFQHIGAKVRLAMFATNLDHVFHGQAMFSCSQQYCSYNYRIRSDKGLTFKRSALESL